MRFLFLLILLILFYAPAYAACTDPDGVPGDLIYNGTYDVFQGCTKRGWTAFHLPKSPPPECSAIGDLCLDGTILAGVHPTTSENIFIPPTDQEDPGTSGVFGMNWKNTSGANDINPDSSNDGRANHTNRLGSITNFPAFLACQNLSFGGHTDWYLPSTNEAGVLYTNRATIEGKGHITNFVSGDYWTSTETNNSTAYTRLFSFGGGQWPYPKNVSTPRVRCIRR